MINDQNLKLEISSYKEVQNVIFYPSIKMIQASESLNRAA